MTAETWTTADKVIEGVKIAAALFFLYVVFWNLPKQLLIHDLLLEWHWGRLLIVGIAYYVARKFFQDSTFQKNPLWQCILWTFYAACVISALVWAGYGTHTEDADPLFGGGTTVIDFVPTTTERNLVGATLFVRLFLPALLGTYLSRRAIERQRRSTAR